jgi:hypothetical protein
MARHATTETIVQTIRDNGGEASSAAIIDELYWLGYSVAYSTLGTALKRGCIVRIRRGVYGLPS